MQSSSDDPLVRSDQVRLVHISDDVLSRIGDICGVTQSVFIIIIESRHCAA